MEVSYKETSIFLCPALSDFAETDIFPVQTLPETNSSEVDFFAMERMEAAARFFAERGCRGAGRVSGCFGCFGFGSFGCRLHPFRRFGSGPHPAAENGARPTAAHGLRPGCELRGKTLYLYAESCARLCGGPSGPLRRRLRTGLRGAVRGTDAMADSRTYRADEQVFWWRDRKVRAALLCDRIRGVGLLPPDAARPFSPSGLEDRSERRSRRKSLGEVFTPAWMCNLQNNRIDGCWFGAEPPFNRELPAGWRTEERPVPFSGVRGRRWQDYVTARRLEAACGQAPYLASRCDAATGAPIAVRDRIGLLDRKLRVVSENAPTERAWRCWAQRAFRSIYGYDCQADNLFRARVNLLRTYLDFYRDRFGGEAPLRAVRGIAEIVSRNLWRMDALSERERAQCRLTVWSGRTAEERPLAEVGFDAIVGNPPYQRCDGGGTGDSAEPIYRHFVDAARAAAPNALSMIVPARWMKGGKGLVAFRGSMMRDTRIREVFDFEDCREVFRGLHIDGGVCAFLWERDYDGPADYRYKPTGEPPFLTRRFLRERDSDTIVRDARQLSVLDKVRRAGGPSFSEWVSSRKPFGFDSALFNRPDDYPGIEFYDGPGADRVRIFGVKGNKGGARRLSRYIDRRHVKRNREQIDRYKLFFSKAFTSTATVPPEIIAGRPGDLCTETFLQIGSWQSEREASACLDYVRTKFFRFLLRCSRHSLNISRKSFSSIPLPDLAQPLTDAELYARYHLDADEIAFIERTVAPMS